MRIIKLYYMKPEELLCKVLYLDGTVTNELLAGKKVIAIVVGDTLISLKTKFGRIIKGRNGNVNV